MRTLAFVIAALLPLTAAAEPVVLRIEAKRGSDGDATAGRWAAQFPDVMTFPLKGGWTGIALGPMERAEAEGRMAELKAARRVPADSFLAPVPADAVAFAAGAPAANTAQPAEATAEPAAAPAEEPKSGATGTLGSTFPAATAQASPQAPAEAAPAAPDDAGQPGGGSAAAPADGADTDANPDQSPADGAAVPGTAADARAGSPAAEASDPAAEAGASPGAAPPAVPFVDAPAAAATEAPGDYIRLQSLSDRTKADEALAGWRKDFPAAGLWQAGKSYVVALGPMPREVAGAWLAALKAAGRAGKGDLAPAADLGSAISAGQAPDLPPAGTAPMPPLEVVQRALRWDGRYDGPIDGRDGPQTRQAIASAVIALRAAPDAGTAMQALIDRREAWRREIGLTRLDDPQSGLSVMAPMSRLSFDRNDHGLSIYGPKDGSGAALILYSAPGGQQKMVDFTGLVTALGWVPSPERKVEQGHAALRGRNATHIGQAEARVTGGRVQGAVLIWPAEDEADQPRVAAEIIDSLTALPQADDAAGKDAGSNGPATPGVGAEGARSEGSAAEAAPSAGGTKPAAATSN